MAKITLGVSQIMKNEAHILPRWYETFSKLKDKNGDQVVDCVTLVDTGSTDDSIKVAKEMGEKYNIPTYIYERPFDDFSSSRNYAMKMAKDKTNYSFWCDLDEILHIQSNVFDKQKLDKGLYMFTTRINSTEYTRNELWCNKLPEYIDENGKSVSLYDENGEGNGYFKWIGPIHEYTVPGSQAVAEKLTSGLAEGVLVEVRFDGASWADPNKLHKKYKDHAVKLEDYIDNVDRDPRWVFYTAQSYHDSSTIPNNKIENDERLRRSMKYYSERVDSEGGYPEERYYAQYRVGTIMRTLEYPWKDCKEALLKAYNIDPMRGESIRAIVEHYQATNEWNLSYLYSKMCVNTFHNMNPYPQRILFVDNPLYQWKSLELHANSCFYTGRVDECKKVFNDLLIIMRTKPQFFTPEDTQRINSNKPHILK